MTLRLGILILIIFCFLGNMLGQSPYQLDWKKELAYFGAGAGTLSLGAYLEKQTPLFDLDQLETLDASSINSFDRWATSNYSLSAHEVSNWLWYGSFAFPTLFLANKNTRDDWSTLFILWGETVLLNSGVTTLSKYAFRRPRPYVYNPNVSTETKMTVTAKASFFSGHTSMTAANTFFAAKVFSDYYPNSKWKPVVWTVAATIPALTGYFRVSAGRHYPTDVIAGYAVGAAIGYLIPHLHQRQENEKGWSINVGSSSALLRYKF
ncbi:MAG: phosphatase PAP2 family protein [Bacteroidota bacterium]